jgi:ATP-dependent helicase Lhr and Lhr-like helicase
LGLDWTVEIRTGDTSLADRSRQRKNPPDILITTPESLHLMLAAGKVQQTFAHLQAVIVDEWHELLSNKRGVQVELGLAHLKTIQRELRIWGISATIGNLEQAMEVLLGVGTIPGKRIIIKADIKKQIEIHTLLLDDINDMPWAGHLGIKLLDKVLPIIDSSESTLIFTNTRAQCEIWYQQILEAHPQLAGILAMHHGSMDRELRTWVENELYSGSLKAVVCTSSLDLGVDFRPVESVIQIGSPKGIARFLQRAGRSGHQPGKVSRIYFLPTHALEIIEGAALREAVRTGRIEDREPVIRAFDVLSQFIVTRAVGDGFQPDILFDEIVQTFAFQQLDRLEFEDILHFTATGGKLDQYESYRRLERDKDGLYRIMNKSMALRHRLSIGTIVGDQSLRIQFVKGGTLGTVEEWFIAQLNPGDVFWFAGRALELVRIKDNTVKVRKSSSNKGKVPSWMGGRMPLSSMLSDSIRDRLHEFLAGKINSPEIKSIKPLLDIQINRSVLPDRNELLIEYFESKEGHHILIYPFEGRFVHEGLGALLAWRISQIRPMSFSIAMNDYGLELLSDVEIPIEVALEDNLFTIENLQQHISGSINAVELAKRRFRDIAAIAGLLFKGFPGREKRDKHLQSSAQLLFNVFQDYDPGNLLYLQSYEEAMFYQLEEQRLRNCLSRIQNQKIKLVKPGRFTPFALPIIADRLRERMSNESLEDRIRKMKLQLE